MKIKKYVSVPKNCAFWNAHNSVQTQTHFLKTNEITSNFKGNCLVHSCHISESTLLLLIHVNFCSIYNSTVEFTNINQEIESQIPLSLCLDILIKCLWKYVSLKTRPKYFGHFFCLRLYMKYQVIHLLLDALKITEQQNLMIFIQYNETIQNVNRKRIQEETVYKCRVCLLTFLFVFVASSANERFNPTGDYQTSKLYYYKIFRCSNK